MKAFAFTGPGARRPFVGGRWPDPGTWSEEGVRASLIGHLPVWIAEELWVVELEGSVHEVETQLRADRGRLVRRVSSWDEDAAAAFVRSCADRILELAGHDGGDSGRMAAYRDDANAFAEAGDANVAGWVAARAAAAAGGEEAAERERARQSAWLADRLQLESEVR